MSSLLPGVLNNTEFQSPPLIKLACSNHAEICLTGSMEKSIVEDNIENMSKANKEADTANTNLNLNQVHNHDVVALRLFYYPKQESWESAHERMLGTGVHKATKNIKSPTLIKLTYSNQAAICLAGSTEESTVEDNLENMSQALRKDLRARTLSTAM